VRLTKFLFFIEPNFFERRLNLYSSAIYEKVFKNYRKDNSKSFIELFRIIFIEVLKSAAHLNIYSK